MLSFLNAELVYDCSISTCKGANTERKTEGFGRPLMYFCRDFNACFLNKLAEICYYSVGEEEESRSRAKDRRGIR